MYDDENELFDYPNEMPPESLMIKAQLDAVKIDELALDEEFIRFAGDLAYWNAVYSNAIKEYLIEKDECEIIRAKVWIRTKEKTKNDKPKPTVDDLKAMVTLDKEYKKARARLIDAEAEKESTRRFAEAMVAKRDMLQSLGAKIRVEMLGDPRIRDMHRDSKGQ